MENLVSKSVTFKGLLAIFQDETHTLFDFIMNLKNEDAKQRLCDEARDYYAKYFNINKEDIWYGNLSGNKIPNPFPYTHIVGDLDWIVNKDMSKLIYLAGSIRNNHIEEYPNLETITGCGDFYGSNIKRLPKLKHAQALYIGCTPIEDIRSLVKVDGPLNCYNTNIKLINPNLEIMGRLYCQKSNHFEEKIDISKKHNWWYTDNLNIL